MAADRSEKLRRSREFGLPRHRRHKLGLHTEKAFIAFSLRTRRVIHLGKAKTSLTKDYAAELTGDVMSGNTICFEELLEVCTDLEAKVNSAIAN